MPSGILTVRTVQSGQLHPSIPAPRVSPTPPSRRQRLIAGAALAALALTPLYTIGEVIAFHSGISVDLRVALTPVPLKLIKDAGMIALVALGFWGITPVARSLARVFAPFAAVCAVSVALTAAANPPRDAALLALSGARWLFAGAVAVGLAGRLDARLMRAVALTLGALAVANCLLQLYQTFHLATPGFGYNSAGLTYRPSGFFINGSTAGYLAVAATFLAWRFVPGRPARTLIIGAAVLGVVLSQAGTAVAALAILGLFAIRGDRHLMLKLAALPVMLALAFLAAPNITGRLGLLEGSGGGRLRLLTQAAGQAGVVSDRFGLGTNTAVVLDTTTEVLARAQPPLVQDSAYVAVLVNTGWAGLATLAGAFIALLGTAIRARAVGPAALLIVLAVMGATQNITETWPANLAGALCLAFYAPALMRASPGVPERPAEPGPQARRLQTAALVMSVAAAAALAAPAVPFEWHRSRAVRTLSGLTAASESAALDAVEHEMRLGIAYQPHRPAGYLVLSDLGLLHADRGEWRDAVRLLRDARAGMPPRPDKTIGMQPQPVLWSHMLKVAERLESAFAQRASELAHAAGVTRRDALDFGDVAALFQHHTTAVTWYRLAGELGAHSQDYLLRLGMALHVAGRPAEAQAAFERSRTAPARAAADGAPLALPANPRLLPAMDLYLSDMCTNPDRRFDAENAVAADAQALVKLADAATAQGRADDARACLALDARFKPPAGK